MFYGVSFVVVVVYMSFDELWLEQKSRFEFVYYYITYDVRVVYLYS